MFGDRYSATEVGRIARESWRNLLFTAVDAARAPVTDRHWIYTVSNLAAVAPLLRNAVAEARGAVLACPHMGSWELAGLAGHHLDLPVFTIAGRQRNPLSNAYLNRLRAATGVEILERDRSVVRNVLARLRQGKILAILPDVRTPTPGLTVDFLGKPANIGSGMASFAQHANVPIIPCIANRHGWSRHHFRVCDPVWMPPHSAKREAWQQMTQAVFDVFTDAIRENPGQWFWFNKRWIFDPASAPAASSADPSP